MRSISVISLISIDAVCGMCYGGGGGGGTSIYKPFRYVPPQRVRFLRRFGLESGLVFRGATVVYEHICRLVPNEYKPIICQFEMDFKKYIFCWRSHLSNDDIICFVTASRFEN